MNRATEYLALAALLALRAVSGSRALPRTRLQFKAEFEDRYSWQIDDDQIEKTLRQIEAWGFLYVLSDKYAGESLKFSKISTDETLARYLPDEVTELLSSAKSGGVAWFRDVFSNQVFWEDLYKEPVVLIDVRDTTIYEKSSGSEFLIPACDRIVALSDNRQTLDLLSADLRGIAEEIRENNEVSVELADEKDIVEGEIKAAETLIAQPLFRI